MMHLIRLYLMCIDLLAEKKIITYREKDHDLLMNIRSGAFLADNNQPTPEFFDMVEKLQQEMDYAKKNTELPDVPDDARIKEFTREVNLKVVQSYLSKKGRSE